MAEIEFEALVAVVKIQSVTMASDLAKYGEVPYDTRTPEYLRLSDELVTRGITQEMR